MIRKEDFIESIGMPDEGFNRAMDEALLQISEEERNLVMKRKLTMTLAAAIIAALVLTGAAWAVGMNLFEYFGKYDKRLDQLAPQAALETAEPHDVESEALGTTHATFSNGYYDGESLIVAFTLENSERYETFEPAPEMLERMEKVDERYTGVVYDENLPGAETVEDFLADKYNGEPCGYVHYSIYPSDHCLANGVDLPPWQEYYEIMEDGSVMHLREFESPLPEMVQNQESLKLEMRLWQMPSYFYFDGENCYELYEKAQPAGAMTAVVHRTDAVMKKFAGEGFYNGVPVSVNAQVSAVRAEVKLSADGRAFPYPEKDGWYDALLTDESGNTLRTAEVDFEGNNAKMIFIGMGSLPEKLTLYVGIEREGEWNEDDFKADAMKVELKDNG